MLSADTSNGSDNIAVATISLSSSNAINNAITLNDYTFTTTTTGKTDWGLATTDIPAQGTTVTNTTPIWKLSDYGCNDYQDSIFHIQQTIDTLNDNLNKKIKEDKNMSNEFDFGPYNGSNIHLSTYGIALQNKIGKWVSYDIQSKKLMDVDILNIPVENKKIFYKIPKALDEVREGDVIIHNGVLVFVESKMKENRFTVIDPVAGTEYVVLPLVSPFGYDFLVVLESIMKYLPEASTSNPFGAFLPLVLGSKDTTDIFTLMLMYNKNFENIDPMVLMAMNGNHSSLALLMMLKNNKTINFNKTINKEDIDE